MAIVPGLFGAICLSKTIHGQNPPNNKKSRCGHNNPAPAFRSMQPGTRSKRQTAARLEPNKECVTADRVGQPDERQLCVSKTPDLRLLFAILYQLRRAQIA